MGEEDALLKVDLIHISRAHVNGKPQDDTFVKLPPERRRPGVCGLLVSNLCGTRGASAAWEAEYSSKMKVWGFARGSASPCVFVHTQRCLMVVVHGADFACTGV